MKSSLDDYRLLEKWIPAMKGVFSCRDLETMLNEPNPVLLNRRIRALQNNKALTRYRRGIYVAGSFDLTALCMRIDPHACLSLGTVLSEALVIGSVPRRMVYAVTTRRNQTITHSLGSIALLSIAPHIHFGYTFSDGVCRATAEKAVLDAWYFHQKGHRFSFDIYSDINLSRIDRNQIAAWLPRYRNPRFVAFARRMLHG